MKPLNSELTILKPSARAKRWAPLMDHALRYLDDRSALNLNPLSRLKHVKEVAATNFAQGVLPRGMALRHLILEAVAQLKRDLAGEARYSRMLTFLDFSCKGLARGKISRELNLNREYVSRKIRPQATELLACQFLRISRNTNTRISATKPLD